jgi:hypothetical protein
MLSRRRFLQVTNAGLAGAMLWPQVKAVGQTAAIYATKENLDYVAAKRAQAIEKKIKEADVTRFTHGPVYECADVSDETYADGMTAAQAIKALGQVKDKAFFLAVGFLKPHLPFVSPKKYWDMYKPESIHTADNPALPTDCPEVAYTAWPELRGYAGMTQEGPVDEKTAQTLIHAYRAAASYTDAQIGIVIATELYDHQADEKENANVAGRPENAAVVKELTDQLQTGWKGMAPA